MEYEKIKQLIDDIGNSKLTSLEIEFPDGTKINAKKENKNTVVSNVQEEKHEQIVEVKAEVENNYKEEGNIVTSPMVGTFYIKPSPNASPYVEIGSKVKRGDVLCIIEAMKLMNEIKSEQSGKVVQICVKNGDPIEYGQVLMYVE